MHPSERALVVDQITRARVREFLTRLTQLRQEDLTDPLAATTITAASQPLSQSALAFVERVALTARAELDTERQRVAECLRHVVLRIRGL